MLSKWCFFNSIWSNFPAYIGPKNHIIRDLIISLFQQFRTYFRVHFFFTKVHFSKTRNHLGALNHHLKHYFHFLFLKSAIYTTFLRSNWDLKWDPNESCYFLNFKNFRDKYFLISTTFKNSKHFLLKSDTTFTILM